MSGTRAFEEHVNSLQNSSRGPDYEKNLNRVRDMVGFSVKLAEATGVLPSIRKAIELEGQLQSLQPEVDKGVMRSQAALLDTMTESLSKNGITVSPEMRIELLKLLESHPFKIGLEKSQESGHQFTEMKSQERRLKEEIKEAVINHPLFKGGGNIWNQVATFLEASDLGIGQVGQGTYTVVPELQISAMLFTAVKIHDGKLDVEKFFDKSGTVNLDQVLPTENSP